MLHGSWGRQTLNDMAYLTTSRLPDGYLTFRSWRIPEPMLGQGRKSSNLLPTSGNVTCRCVQQLCDAALVICTRNLAFIYHCHLSQPTLPLIIPLSLRYHVIFLLSSKPYA